MNEHYSVYTLGAARITDSSGRPVDLPTGRPFAVLLYLLLARRPISRDELAALLWSTSQRERALASVRNAVWLIRKAFGDVVTGEESLQLRTEHFSLDVSQSLERLDAGDTDGALALWESPFCERHVVAGAPNWQQWVDERRREFAARFGRGLDHAAELSAAAYDYDSALRYLRKAVELQPFEIQHCERLISLLLDLDKVGEADAVARDLHDRFGDPEYEQRVNTLFTRIRAADSRRIRDPVRSLMRPEFVGREADLAAIMSAWRSAREGGRRCVLVSGEPGIGKTRLAEEASDLARADDAKTLRINATPADVDIEWGLISLLIRQILVLPGAAGVSTASDRVLRTLVPSQSSQATAPDRPTAVALSDALADLIGAVAYESPLFLVIDDLHSADAASRAILLRLIAQLQRDPVMFVITYRSTDPSRELPRQIDHLERMEGIVALRLRPLARVDFVELVSSTIDCIQPQPLVQLAHDLFDATAGNPLFAVESLQALTLDGVLAYGSRGWVLLPDRLPRQLPVPHSLHALLDRKIDHLSPDAARLAGALSATPHAGTLKELRAASGLSEDAMGKAVSELLDREVVRWDHDDLAFTHESVRDAARQRFRSPAPVGVRSRVVIAAVLAVVLLAGGWEAIRRLRAVEPRFGGGEIWITSGDSFLVARPSRSASDWSVERATNSGPQPPSRPFPSTAGGLRWFRHNNSPNESPYPIEILPNGQKRPVFRSSMDVALGGLSPDGGSISLFLDDTTTAAYDMGLYIAGANGSNPRKIYQATTHLHGGYWAPDGHAVAALVVATVDTVLVLSPFGERLAATPFRDATLPVWCGNNRLLFVTREGGDMELTLLDLTTGVARRLHVGAAKPDYGCSPDGSAAVVLGIESGRLALQVVDLRTLAMETIDLPGNVRPYSAAWMPSKIGPVATSVVIDDSALSLRWGERRQISTSVRYTDGSTQPSPVRWNSTNEAVATVSPGGMVTANGPGKAELVATAAGVRSRVLSVEVTGAMVAGVALQERFETLDTMTWHIVGKPAPRLRRINGEPVLQLTGDGNYADGITSRADFDLSLGGTLEFEFRFRELNRRDRQWLAARLAIGSVAAGGSPQNPADWRWSTNLGFGYPARDLAKFDPGEASVHVNYIGPLVRIDSLLKPGAWNHLALQIRSDGQMSTYLNRMLVAEPALRADPRPGEKWHVIIEGSAVDTELLVRNVVLWNEPRYGAPRPR